MNQQYSTLKSELTAEVKDHILPFWMGLADWNHGGYYGLVRHDLTVDPHADKGCILNSRLLYFFSEYIRVLGGKDETSRDVMKYAVQAYRELRDHFCDPVHQGLYWSVTYDGHPSDTAKYTYNMAFAIYGLSKYHAVSKDPEALDLAMEIFRCIEEKCRLGDGYGESYTIDFEPIENEKISENNVIAAKTMNTLLHVMEAYTELYRETGEQKVLDRLVWCVKEFRNKVYEEDRKRLGVFFDEDMKSLIDLHSYGHDIEGTWLLDRAVEVTGDPDLGDLIWKMNLDITENICHLALRQGSLLTECERGVNLEKRVWWVQCEAVTGFFNAYQKVMDVRYLDAALEIWYYIKEHFIDRREGSEWFNELFADGTPDSSMPMANEWKCPYHNGRMCLEMIERIDAEERKRIPVDPEASQEADRQ